MPRLVILCEYPTLLGGEHSMLATLPAIAAAGFDVRVAAPGSGALAEGLAERGVRHLPLETHDASGTRLPLEDLRSVLAALVRREEPQLVHANSLSMSRIAGPVAAGIGVPAIGHLRDIIKLSSQAIADLNTLARLIAVSEATRRFHVEQGLDGGRCMVAHNGVNLSEFFPRPPKGYLHRELGLSEEVRFVATVGQLGLRKGTDVALMAAARVAIRVPALHWLVVGERTSMKDESREFEAELRRLAGEPPLCGRVHFLGRRSDMPQLMNECVLLVHAARQEPLGRVLLESAASGLPVVATDVGGTREIFPNEAGGAILVPIDDVVALAATEINLLSDQKLHSALSAGARRRAEVAFDIRRASARILEIYSDVLS